MTEIRSNRKTIMDSMKDYDGFYLLPGDDITEVEYRFFKFNDEKEMGEKIEGTAVGDKYHVAFFKNIDNELQFDDAFEAIFADPLVYAKNLYGINIFGVFVKKREKSSDWFDNYLKSVMSRVMILKMREYAQAIADAEKV